MCSASLGRPQNGHLSVGPRRQRFIFLFVGAQSLASLVVHVRREKGRLLYAEWIASHFTLVREWAAYLCFCQYAIAVASWTVASSESCKSCSTKVSFTQIVQGDPKIGREDPLYTCIVNSSRNEPAAR